MPVAALLAPVPDGGDPPAEIVVLPAGPRITARDGRWWTLEDAAEVARRSTEAMGGQDAVIDFEHQSLHAPENGRPAPAAGWITGFEARDGAVVALVGRWTPRAAEMLRNGEYRFVSPVFRHEKAGARRIQSVINVALTNVPALPDIPAVARRRIDEEESMTLKDLLAKLGLAEDADEAAVDAALASARAADLAPIAEAAGLAKDADARAVAEGVAALRDPATAPDPAKWVPRGEFDVVAGRLTALETQTAEAAATAAVDAATQAGKVAPASREWALAYASRDPDGFGKFVDSAPVIVAAGEQPRAAPGKGDATLSAEEMALCRATGVSTEAYLAERDKEAA